MRLDSLRTRTMIVLVLSCALIVLVLGGIWLYSNQVYTAIEIHNSDIRDSRHLAEILNMYLDDIISNVDLVSTSPDTLASLRDNNSRRLAQILDNLEMISPRPDYAFVVDGRGDILYSTRALNTTNIRIYDWYTPAINTTGSYVTGLYFSRNVDGYAFAVLTPVRDNGSVLGGIVAVFTPESLQDSIQEHNLDPRDNIVVVDGGGTAISSNNLSVIGRNTDLSGYTPVQALLRGERGVIEHADSWDGQPRITAYQPVRYGRWGVLVSTPQSVEYRPLFQRAEWILGVLMIFTVLFSAFGYMASRYLTDPITDISQAMQKIASGDYSMRVRTSRKDEIGQLVHTFNTMMDRLEEASAQMNMYLDLMGHDINNLNQVALGYLEVAEHQIASGTPLGPGDQKLIRKPIDALGASSKLIENVRKLQAAKAGTLSVQITDVCEILAELKKQYSQVPGRQIQISLEGPERCPVMANELLKDVFANLIWNAIKHSDPGKPLTIGLAAAAVTYRGAIYYRITVEDNGPGIKDELKDVLFLRFRRGDTKAQGSGLGLYLVKTLVEGFHGEVWVEDRVQGDYTRGSRFIVMLPAATPQYQSTAISG